jgi:hypothetical protein
VLPARDHDCDVLTALGDSLELEPLASSELDEPALDASLLSLDSVLPLDSSPLVPASLDSAAPELVDPPLLEPLLLASPADSLPLVLDDLPLLSLVFDFLWTVEVERAFDEADNAGSCPDASWT